MREGHIPCHEKGRFRSGPHVCEMVSWEETAKMQRDILETVFYHPAAEGGNLPLGVIQTSDKKVRDFDMDACNEEYMKEKTDSFLESFFNAALRQKNMVAARILESGSRLVGLPRRQIPKR